MFSPLGGDLPTQAYVDAAASLTVACLTWSTPFVALCFRARRTERLRELAAYQTVAVALLLLTAAVCVVVFMFFPPACIVLAPFLGGPALLWWFAKKRAQHLRERLFGHF